MLIDIIPLYMRKGLEVAEAYGDPFYLWEFHNMIADTKISGLTAQPFTIREVKQHHAKANQYKKQCERYTTDIAFHRGEQCQKHVKREIMRSQNENYVDEDKLVMFPVMDAPDADEIDAIEKGEALEAFRSQFLCANPTCGQIIAHKRVCFRCLKASYCNEACQKEHWMKGHKRECVPSKKTGEKKAKSNKQQSVCDLEDARS